MNTRWLKYFGIIWVLLITQTVDAQQDAQYTQYMYNMNVLNPAYAGSKEGTISAGLLGRTQWVGIPGAPNTATLSVHSPITERMGLGLSIIADKIGPVDEEFVYVDYSYTIPVGFYDNLAFGLKGGFSVVNAKLIDLQTIEIDDVNFDTNIGNFQPNIGFGVFYYSDIYYVGVSLPSLLSTTYIEKKGGVFTNLSKRNHLFVTGGYVYDLSYDWKFKPSALIKATTGAPVSVDLSANFLFDETFEAGASYRWGDSVSLLFNAKVTDNIRVGYSYDFTTSELNNFNSGSHEIMILFDLMTAYEIISPRFF
jgi:type IX secretion system PorP/SprF family membrane protein